jgi:ribosomal protein S18 acetylase RimI-like enzyme
MSELRPNTPAQRPESARPRSDTEPVIEPPSIDELTRMERHLASLPGHTGATLTDDPSLGVLLVQQPGEGPAWNYAAMPRWSPDGWQGQLSELVEVFRRWSAWPSLLVADRLDRPIGLGDALDSVGWSAVVRETVMWVGRASVVPHLDASMRIEAVKPSTVADHELLERRVFGLPGSQGAARRKSTAGALDAGDLRAYVVRVGDEPVAVARLSQGDGVAGIYGVGVAEGWRNRGYGTLITTVATRAGLALGNRLVWLSVDPTNDPALHVYRKLGFEPAFNWTRWMIGA